MSYFDKMTWVTALTSAMVRGQSQPGRSLQMMRGEVGSDATMGAALGVAATSSAASAPAPTKMYFGRTSRMTM